MISLICLLLILPIYNSQLVPSVFFFFNDTATTEIYTLSLHDALPISGRRSARSPSRCRPTSTWRAARRSEEHTSELQSRFELVCRLLLEKKNHYTDLTVIFQDGRLRVQDTGQPS